MVTGQTRPTVGMGDNRCSIFCKRQVSIRMVEVPMCVNQPARRLVKRQGHAASYFIYPRAIARVDYGASLRRADCRYRAAGSHKSEDLGTNLCHGQWSALVRNPALIDKASSWEAMAVIHSN